MQTTRRLLSHCLLATAVASLSTPLIAAEADAAKVLRIVPQSNVTILDPIWSSAYTTRNHGYMIYDTLFGTDMAGNVKPQMVDKWEVSQDQKTWTFTLRPGLVFSDGAPVTSDDVIASLKRWAVRDSMGGAMVRNVERFDAVNAGTFRIVLGSAFGPMLQALGKPSSNVPFIMPKRIADTPASEQIKEYIGSGPYVFKADEFRPGVKLVYLKNERYRPRSESADGTTGGKLVKVDRVEWVILRDPQTQLNALSTGDVDLIEMPAFEQYPVLRADPNVVLFDMFPAGNQFVFRFNHLHAPFDNQKVRQAALAAFGQEALLKTQVGDPALYKVCLSIYPCGTPYSTNTTALGAKPDVAKAKRLLAEAGYKGEPVVLMRPTDLAALAKIPLMAKQQLEAAGFKVDLQSMDWQSVIARRVKKDTPASGGWSAFISGFVGSDLLNPLTIPFLNATGANGYAGWQDDPTTEALKVRYARATTEADRKEVAAQVQARVMETGSYAPLGQVYAPSALRKNVHGVLASGANVYWNISKD
ncbi:MAG: ABC transporter substrate-binding protein [Pseudomonadota bacterium]